MSSISIIIPVYNNSHFTQSCINDLKKIIVPEIEFIFIDNASTDETKNILNKIQSEDKRFRFISNEKNEYFAKACNKGFSASNGEYVCFLNNDIRVKSNHENWILKLVEGCQDNSVVGPTGCLLGTDFHFIKNIYKIERRNFYISAWCIMAKKEMWKSLILPKEIGPFSSEFGLFFEDGDLSFRAEQQNITLKIVPVPLIHIIHGTAKKLDINKLYLKAHNIFKTKWSAKMLASSCAIIS